jgi:hypothetical protein
MLLDHRILYSDNGTFSDLTSALNNVLDSASVLAWVAAQDALYLGSELPFNHRYIEVSVANDQASVASVQIWNGSSWENAVDVLDLTALAGKTLAQSGVLSWSPDKDGSGFQKAESTEDVTGLTSFKIYDRYWVKITFSADLKATTALKYIGHKFSEDADLTQAYPLLALTELKTAFALGGSKTSWMEQAVLAAEEIIADLKSMGVAESPNQLLDWSVLKLASVHKTAEIIFRAFGTKYKDDLAEAKSAYSRALQIKNFAIDRDRNARLTKAERQPMRYQDR